MRSQSPQSVDYALFALPRAAFNNLDRMELALETFTAQEEETRIGIDPVILEPLEDEAFGVGGLRDGVIALEVGSEERKMSCDVGANENEVSGGSCTVG